MRRYRVKKFGEFVSTIATRVIELTSDGYVDFAGTYDEYLASQS